MTKRMIHNNICVSNKIGSISLEAEILYYRLLVQTDDYGNTYSGAGYVKDTCFPKSKTSGHKNNNFTYDQVENFLDELIKIGLIEIYTIDDVDYYHFYKFEEFQELRKDRLKKSPIPSPNQLRTSYDITHQNIAAEEKKVCPHELEEELEEEEEEEGDRNKIWFDKVNKISNEENFPKDFIPIFVSWFEYKKARKESYKTDKSMIAFCKKLIRFSENSSEIAQNIIEDSMANNWAGIFEPKDKNNNKDSPQQYNNLPTYTNKEDLYGGY